MPITHLPTFRPVQHLDMQLDTLVQSLFYQEKLLKKALASLESHGSVPAAKSDQGQRDAEVYRQLGNVVMLTRRIVDEPEYAEEYAEDLKKFAGKLADLVKI